MSASLQDRVSRLVRRLLPDRTRGVRGVLPALWVGVAIALEVTGRLTPSDISDAVAILLLVALAAFTWREHARRPLPWLERFAIRPLAGLLDRARVAESFDAGSDLRREPPLPRRVPPPILWTGGAAIAVTGALFLARAFLPEGAREVLTTISGALYLLGLTLLWITLGVGSLAVFLVPIALHGWLEERRGKAAGFSLVLASQLFAGYFVLLATLAYALPRWVPLCVSGVVLLSAVAVRTLPDHPRMDIVWRRANASDPPTVFNLTVLDAWQRVLVWCALASISLLAGGDRLFGAPAEPATMPFTAGLSALFTWSTCAWFAGEWALDTAEALRRRIWNPERFHPAIVRVFDRTTSGARVAVAALEPHGFAVRHDDEGEREPTDVCIHLVDELSPRVRDAFALSESWPLDVTGEEVPSKAIAWKLARRHEVLCRRHFLRGLARALRGVERSERNKALGFWIDPHQPYSTSLNLQPRGGDEPYPIGPPYRGVIPLAARSHLSRVLRALAIDLVFVERGVSFKQLRRVYAVLFEAFDMHGGRERAVERHFRGLIGLRVLIDEISPENGGLRTTDYPEPNYTDIGRARILHVYRDRGGEEEVVLRPRSSDDVPVPTLVPMC